MVLKNFVFLNLLSILNDENPMKIFKLTLKLVVN